MAAVDAEITKVCARTCVRGNVCVRERVCVCVGGWVGACFGGLAVGGGGVV